MWRRRAPFLVALVAALVYLATLLAIPLVTKEAIDRVVIRGRLVELGPTLIALLGLGLIRAAAGVTRKLNAARLMSLVGNDLRERLYDHVQRLSYNYHDRVGVGQLMARASSDLAVLENALAMLPFAVQSAIVAVGGVTIMFVLDARLAGALVATVIVSSVVAIRANRPLAAAGRTVRTKAGVWTAFVEQRVGGIGVVKAHGLEEVQQVRGRQMIEQLQHASLDQARLRARFFAASTAVPAAAMLVVVGFGGSLALRGALTPGGLFAFLQYLWTLVGPVMTAATIAALFPEAIVAAGRLAEVLREEVEIREPALPERLPSEPPTIRFEHVSFRYVDRDSVLDDLSLEVPAGTSLALVGPTGSGKSTIARLLPRFFDPSAGLVTLNGVPLGRFSVRALRAAVAVVFQDTVMFTASVRENITLGFPASDEQIRWAARVAHADAFIEDLPDGFATVLEAQGMHLSGGQRQRIAIARAVLRDPLVLVLDDAVSAVDPVTHDAILDGLGAVMRGRTTLIVAHDPRTVALADRAVLLDRGRIVASGSHDELLARADYRAALGLVEEATG